MKKLIPYSALVMAMILWSSTFVGLKYSFGFFSPVFVIFARMAIASICFLPLLPFLKPEKIKKKDMPFIIGMAFFEPCLYFIFETMSLKYTSSSQAGMITAILPILVGIGSFIFFSEKISLKGWGGFFTAVAGAVILSSTGAPTESSPNPLLGNFFEFMAMVCATGYTLLLKRLSSDYNTFFLTAVQSFCGAMFFGGIFLFSDQPFPSTWPVLPSVLLVYLGIFVTMGAYGLYNFGVSRISAAKATVFVNLIPVFSIFWGWSILSERLNLVQCFGAVLIISGVWISQDTKTEEVESKADPDLCMEEL